ncbi:MAG: hypothetical protein JOS17DRAFT_743178 [Linnemannia elongata]|nr:MAG: hypothetical protein JOS17DRAFT_743178 [Linnemannia elongata]
MFNERRQRECLYVKESHQGSVVVATKVVLKTVSRIHLALGVVLVLMGITSVGSALGLLLISMGLSLSLGLRLALCLTALSSFTLCSDSASLNSKCIVVGVLVGTILVFVLAALLAVIAVMAGSTTLQRGKLFGNPFREAAPARRIGGDVGVGIGVGVV